MLIDQVAEVFSDSQTRLFPTPPAADAQNAWLVSLHQEVPKKQKCPGGRVASHSQRMHVRYRAAQFQQSVFRNKCIISISISNSSSSSNRDAGCSGTLTDEQGWRSNGTLPFFSSPVLSGEAYYSILAVVPARDQFWFILFGLPNKGRTALWYSQPRSPFSTSHVLTHVVPPHSVRLSCIFSPYPHHFFCGYECMLPRRGTHIRFLCKSTIHFPPPCPLRPSAAWAGIPCFEPSASPHVAAGSHHVSSEFVALTRYGPGRLCCCPIPFPPPSLAPPYCPTRTQTIDTRYDYTFTLERRGGSYPSLDTTKHMDGQYIIVQMLPPEYQVHHPHHSGYLMQSINTSGKHL